MKLTPQYTNTEKATEISKLNKIKHTHKLQSIAVDIQRKNFQTKRKSTSTIANSSYHRIFIP